MLNRIVLMGRLTRDPEKRMTQSGTAVASFTLAVDRDYSGKGDGEKQTDFIDVVAWRGTADFVAKYFTKGRMAVVSGRLQIRDWTDKYGNKRRSAEVVADNVYFGDSKREDPQEAAYARAEREGMRGAGKPVDVTFTDMTPEQQPSLTEFGDEDDGDLPL